MENGKWKMENSKLTASGIGELSEKLILQK
jgi:hypothetical protein